MPTKPRIDRRELDICLFLSLVIDLIARPGAKPMQAGAQAAVWAAVINAALVVAVWTALEKLCPADKWFLPRKNNLARLAAFVLLCAAAGESITAAFRFLQSSAEWKLPFWLFLLLIGLLAVYGVQLGAEGVARSGEVLAVMLAFSIFAILLSNWQNASAEQLTIRQDLALTSLKAAASSFRLSPVLLSWAVLGQETQNGFKGGVQRAVFAAAAGFVLLTIAGEGVLGSFAAQHSQPVYTLARVGSLSVFRRIDSLHAFVWALVLVEKIVFLLLAASRLALGSGRVQKRAAASASCLLAALAAGLSLGAQTESWYGALTIFTALTALLAAAGGKVGTIWSKNGKSSAL